MSCIALHALTFKESKGDTSQFCLDSSDDVFISPLLCDFEWSVLLVALKRLLDVSLVSGERWVCSRKKQRNFFVPEKWVDFICLFINQ